MSTTLILERPQAADVRERQRGKGAARSTLRIAMLASRPVGDAGYWSGIPANTAANLAQVFDRFEVRVYDERVLKRLLMPLRMLARLAGRTWHAERSAIYRALLRSWMRATLHPERYDVLFTHHSWIAACTPAGAPLITWADAEFQSYAEAYLSRSERARLVGAAEAVQGERLALARASRTLLSSAWAIGQVKARYATDPVRLILATLPEDLPSIPSGRTVDAYVAARPSEVCRLLFIGVEWRRKGGDRALELVRELRRLGLPAELDIVGASPLPASAKHCFVRQHGFLDKRDPQQAACLQRLLAHSAFLVLPSRAEAMGVVLVEAAAYGLPAIVSDVQGVTSVVAPGVNGIVSAWDDVSALAVQVRGLHQDPVAYRRMASAARHRFERELSWNARRRQLLDLFEEVARPDKPQSVGAIAQHPAEQEAGHRFG